MEIGEGLVAIVICRRAGLARRLVGVGREAVPAKRASCPAVSCTGDARVRISERQGQPGPLRGLQATKPMPELTLDALVDVPTWQDRRRESLFGPQLR
jgi:hypothetical protein